MNRIHKIIFNRTLGVWQAVGENARTAGTQTSSSAALSKLGWTILLFAINLPAQAHDIDTPGEVVVTSTSPQTWLGSDELSVGKSVTGAALTIKQSGVVNNAAGYIGQDVGSSGAVTVDGLGSGASWTNSGVLYVGRDGTGTLDIRNGGIVSSTSGLIGQNSDNGSANGSGTVTVDGNGSTWINSSAMGIGNFGTGTLTIQNGGTVSGVGATIGFITGSSGTVTVDGNGSTWTVSDSFVVGGRSNGSLTISNGGVVNSTGLSSAIGAYEGDSDTDTATVTVDGSGSTWTTSGNLVVGGYGNGALTIQNGGTVSGDIGSIGNFSGSNGSVTVDGNGSTLTHTGELTVGFAGDGTLTITNGATVTNTTGYIGRLLNGDGVVTVDGSGSTWVNSGDLYAGKREDGSLTIRNGGTVSSTNGYIGGGWTKSGTVTVDGSGSSWTNSGYLIVGSGDGIADPVNFTYGFGDGTLTIANGGLVTASHVEMASLYSDALVHSRGTLNLAGTTAGRGVLETGYLTKGAGIATFNWNGGILRAIGDQADFIQNFGSGSIDIQSEGAFVDSNGFDIGISAPLDGVGGLTKQGSGTLTLSGDGTYTGGTTISTGTLALSGNGSLASTGSVSIDNGATFDISASSGDRSIGALSGAGDVVLGTRTLTTDSVVNTTFAGGISGTGGLTKQGTGTLTLSGTNTYSGGTTISAGKLALSGTGSLASTGSVSVASGATFDISAASGDRTIGALSGAGNVLLGTGTLTTDSAVNTAFAGDISGTGNLSKQGSGTLTLTGNNSIGNNVRIDTGTLLINGGGALSSTSGSISSGGAIAVSGINSQWHATSDITMRTSTLTVDNGASIRAHSLGMSFFGSTSTFNLNGTSSARGILEVDFVALDSTTGIVNWNGGILRAAADEADFIRGFSASNIDIQSGGAVIDSNGFNIGIDTVLDGVGGLTKQGNGTLTLSSANTYTGATTVSAGTLTVNGSTLSATTVNSGGTLSGSGSVGSTTLMNGGTVHAAGSDMLTINGNYTQQAGGVLRLDATDTGNYGKLAVNGNAVFAARSKIDVNVNAVNTLAIDNVLHDVVTATGSLASSGFAVTDNSALFSFRARQTGSSLDLFVVQNSSTGIRDAVLEHRLWPALGAADVLDLQLNNGATGDMGTVIDALGQLPGNRDVARAAAQTLPLVSGNQAIQGTLASFQRLVQERIGGAGATGLSSGDDLANRQIWGRAFGSRADQDDRDGTAGFNAESWGLAFGADAKIAPGARFGLAYGYADTAVDGNADLAGTGQHANIASHILSVYGSKDIGGNRTLRFQGDAGLNNNESTRPIEFGGLRRTASGDYRTYSAHLGLALSQEFAMSEKTSFTPMLRADYTWLKSQSYDESGADSLDLQVDSNRTEAFVIGADARLQHRFSTVSWLDAYIGAGYDTINDRGNIVAAYAGAPAQAFVTPGIDHSPWLMHGGIGYRMTTANGTEITLRYDAEGRSDYINQTASVKANWAF